MNASAVELLVGKGHLPTEQALAVVEAIEMALDSRQLVTVPIMDSRFTTLRADIDTRFGAFRAEMDVRFANIDARFDKLEARSNAALEAAKAELVRWVFLVMLGNVALTAAVHAFLNTVQNIR